MVDRQLRRQRLAGAPARDEVDLDPAPSRIAPVAAPIAAHRGPAGRWTRAAAARIARAPFGLVITTQRYRPIARTARS